MNNNGNVNNNNKYNGLTAVPLSELDDKARMKEERKYLVPIGHIWDAYYMCVKNKRRTMNAMLFDINVERKIIQLWRNINDRTYEIGRSVTFIVEHPVKREVFAADFRDRIVHDYICMRVEPLIEARLPECMTSNRKGKGTHYAIENVAKGLRDVSEGYTKDCWIWKFDLKGFFMSIDKPMLNEKIQALIDSDYHGPDKEVLKWLTEKVVRHCPQMHCIRKSLPCAWIGLRADKSLFTQDRDHGMPIGNLPSQIFANYLLSGMVSFLRENCFETVTQYVDDVVVIHPDKNAILAFIPRLRTFLKDELGITLHPKKCYIQHYRKGVAFVGGIIKPWRNYVSKRTRRKMLGKIHWLTGNRDAMPSEKMLASVNSYLGHTRHFSAYKIREKAMEMMFGAFSKDIYFTNNIEKMAFIK